MIGRLLAMVLWLVGSAASDAAENRRKNYALPGGDAVLALHKFADQSGEQVIFLLNQVKGVRTNPVNGRFTAREAIERLVADTQLRVVADQQTGAFMVQRITDPAPADDRLGPSEKKSPEKSDRTR